MLLLKLTLITLLSTAIYAEKTAHEGHDHAQAVQIDMHGGKEVKTPSKLAPKASKKFYGNILEIKSAMGYKYLKIDENGTKLWIAIANAAVEVGDRIGYDKNTMMTNFESKSLEQKFDTIYFVSNIYLPQKNTRPKSMKDMLGLSTSTKNPHANIDRSMASKVTTTSKPFIKKERYTVEEVHIWREALKGQNITLEGTVSKVSHAIMKRDWIHIKDGSGNEKKLTNDLIFTGTDTTVKSGDKVIAKGKIIVDKDFGYGYFYKVIIEDANFQVLK